jgi:hypothetical protein
MKFLLFGFLLLSIVPGSLAQESPHPIAQPVNHQLADVERQAQWQESPAYRVLEVLSTSTILLQIDREKRFVLLAGIAIEDDEKAEQFLLKRLLHKEACLRCFDQTGTVADLTEKEGAINAQLLRLGLAQPLDSSDDDP